jgi:hypothetical protein
MRVYAESDLFFSWQENHIGFRINFLSRKRREEKILWNDELIKLLRFEP